MCMMLESRSECKRELYIYTYICTLFNIASILFCDFHSFVALQHKSVIKPGTRWPQAGVTPGLQRLLCLGSQYVCVCVCASSPQAMKNCLREMKPEYSQSNRFYCFRFLYMALTIGITAWSYNEVCRELLLKSKVMLYVPFISQCKLFNLLYFTNKMNRFSFKSGRAMQDAKFIK